MKIVKTTIVCDKETGINEILRVRRLLAKNSNIVTVDDITKELGIKPVTALIEFIDKNNDRFVLGRDRRYGKLAICGGKEKTQGKYKVGDKVIHDLACWEIVGGPYRLENERGTYYRISNHRKYIEESNLNKEECNEKL